MTIPLTVTRITHSCVLLQFGDTALLTDPWFSEKAGYHPGEPIAMTPAQLPKLTAVLISHAHYDHCDMRAFAAYPDLSVPIVAARTVVAPATEAGFTDVRVISEWQTTVVDGVTITGVPGKHAVYEIGFVIQAGGRTVYFAGDTLSIPALAEIPDRFGHLDLALLPTNGLRIRPMFNRQVVMNADEAAQLTAVLKPDHVVPHHYAFTGGPIADLLLAKGDRDPEHYRVSAGRLAPNTRVHIVRPGEPVHL